jgi:hypothetical protein
MLDLFCMIQGFSRFQQTCALLRFCTVFGSYLFVTIATSVFVSTKEYENKCWTTQFRLLPLRFHPYTDMFGNRTGETRIFTLARCSTSVHNWPHSCSWIRPKCSSAKTRSRIRACQHQPSVQIPHLHVTYVYGSVHMQLGCTASFKAIVN